MSLPWRWFGTDAEEPDWIGEVRRALTPISDALPEIDNQQARWPTPDWEGRPDPRASDRHWLLEQPELQVARSGLERLGFDVVGEPLPVRGRDRIVRAAPSRLAGRPWRPTALPSRTPHVKPPFPLTLFDAYSPLSGAALRIEWERDPWPYFAQRELSMLQADVRYLVLGRRWKTRRGVQTYTRSEQVLESIFGDSKARADLASKLPLRGVLLTAL